MFYIDLCCIFAVIMSNEIGWIEWISLILGFLPLGKIWTPRSFLKLVNSDISCYFNILFPKIWIQGFMSDNSAFTNKISLFLLEKLVLSFTHVVSQPGIFPGYFRFRILVSTKLRHGGNPSRVVYRYFHHFLLLLTLWKEVYVLLRTETGHPSIIPAVEVLTSELSDRHGFYWLRNRVRQGTKFARSCFSP